MNEIQIIPWAKPNLWGNEKKYIFEALESTWISGGPFVERFEKSFRDYSGVPYALTTSNGTTAIHLAFLALGVGEGDEVIVPGFAFMAAANLAMLSGAKPVFAEIDSKTWCITAENIEKRISKKTKAIVPVHTYGNVCKMDEIMAVGKKYQIPIIEDAAESLTSRFRGRLSGTIADIGTYSFQATKIITTGEGGMVTTANEDLNQKMILYRSHGMLRKTYYWHDVPGHNFRLTNLQAAMGVAQMEKLNEIVSARNRVSNLYRKLLQEKPGVTMQYFPPGVDGIPWVIALKLDPDAYPQGRDTVLKQMLDLRIETRPGFYAANFLKHIYRVVDAIPVSDEVSRQVISLPMFATLTDEQIDYIVKKLMGLRR